MPCQPFILALHANSYKLEATCCFMLPGLSPPLNRLGSKQKHLHSFSLFVYLFIFVFFNLTCASVSPSMFLSAHSGSKNLSRLSRPPRRLGWSSRKHSSVRRHQPVTMRTEIVRHSSIHSSIQASIRPPIYPSINPSIMPRGAKGKLCPTSHQKCMIRPDWHFPPVAIRGTEAKNLVARQLPGYLATPLTR